MQAAFQPTLFAEEHIGPTDLTGRVERLPLDRGAWVDVLPGWLSGADELFPHLVAAIPWRAESRPMYDRVVDVPRLVHTYGVGAPLPHPALTEARERLSAHYADELGEPFVTAGCCYYRDGHDSVAWHGDTVGTSRAGRGRQDTTSAQRLRRPVLVAIVSFGAARKLLLRPRGGSTAHALPLGHGDLVVMGGSCQRTWEHAVPKTARPVGPRISVQFRPRNVF